MSARVGGDTDGTSRSADKAAVVAAAGMVSTEAAAAAAAAAAVVAVVAVVAAEWEGPASVGPRSGRSASAGSVVDLECVAGTSAPPPWPCCPSSR
jgi:hypothetical protein